jgi:hypothetical protein
LKAESKHPGREQLVQFLLAFPVTLQAAFNYIFERVHQLRILRIKLNNYRLADKYFATFIDPIQSLDDARPE